MRVIDASAVVEVLTTDPIKTVRHAGQPTKGSLPAYDHPPMEQVVWSALHQVRG